MISDRPSRGAVLCAVLIGLAAIAFGPSAFAAGDAAAQQELVAIREALIRAAREAPTRVLNTAWIDEHGALQENTSFHSSAEVRAVRVVSYLEHGADQPSVRATAQIALPAHVRAAAALERRGPQAATDTANCQAMNGPWRLPVSLGISAHSAGQPNDAAVLAMLARAAQHWWQMDAGRAVRWLPLGAAQATFLEGSGGPPQLTAGPPQGYRRSLLGPDPRSESWRAHLRLDAPTDASRFWRIALSLVRTIDSVEVVSESVTVPLPTTREGFVGQHALVALRTSLTHWQRRVDLWMACEPPVIEAQSDDAAGWTLPVGSEAGLRVGQRVLVLDRQRVPSRWAEPEGLAALAIAEVSSVSAQRSALKLIVGPKRGPQSDWVVLPL